MESLRKAPCFGLRVCLHAHMCVPGYCSGGGSDFRLWQALCWRPALQRRYCQVPDGIRESLPMENMSVVHGNKHQLPCVEDEGHCSEGIDPLEPRLTLKGVERLLWT